MTLYDQIAQYIMSGLTTGAIYALVALGFCLIYNTTRIVNFAQGDFLSLGGLMMYTFLVGAGLPAPLSFPMAVLAVALVGALLERLCIRPAKSRQVIVLIFITIAASILMRGVFKHLWGKDALALPSLSPEVPLKLLGAHAQQAARAQEQDQQEHHKGHYVLVGTGDQAGGQALQKPQHQAAHDGPQKTAVAAQHRGGKAL